MKVTVLGIGRQILKPRFTMNGIDIFGIRLEKVSTNTNTMDVSLKSDSFITPSLVSLKLNSGAHIIEDSITSDIKYSNKGDVAMSHTTFDIVGCEYPGVGDVDRIVIPVIDIDRYSKIKFINVLWLLELDQSVVYNQNGVEIWRPTVFNTSNIVHSFMWHCYDNTTVATMTANISKVGVTLSTGFIPNKNLD